MKPLFYFHARISAGRNVDTGVSIDPVYGREHFRRQMDAAVKSGLIENCEEFTIGLNGSPSDLGFVESIVPAKVRTILHPEGSESLLPTMQLLQRELKDHPDAVIGFAHTKSITRPGNRLYQNWLGCLQRHVVENWRECVRKLEENVDTASCHWTLNSPTDPNADRWGANPYWAGCFWWATAEYLMTLPALPEKIVDRHTWFQGGELWIGCGNPRIFDFHPGPIFIHA
jgi:hypothetical protein